MLTQIDVTRFASYQWGVQAGIAQGIEQGFEKGITYGIVKGALEGQREKSQAIARSLLSLGVLTEADIAKVTGLTLEELQQIKNQH